jgi:mono/diheme cytochrome c family protein
LDVDAGRNNWNRALWALALVLCAGAIACSRPTPAAERTPVDASALFAQACAKCHAADGTGGLPMAVNGPRPADLTTVDWQRSRSDAEVISAIRNGRGAMPPFQEILSSQQIDAIAAYVRTLKRP